MSSAFLTSVQQGTGLAVATFYPVKKEEPATAEPWPDSGDWI